VALIFDAVVCGSGTTGRHTLLLFSNLTRIGPEPTQKLRERVANEISATFASSFTHENSLAEALETIRGYGRMATGEKYLLVPSKE
jgi:NADPH:quinone reductase